MYIAASIAASTTRNIADSCIVLCTSLWAILLVSSVHSPSVSAVSSLLSTLPPARTPWQQVMHQNAINMLTQSHTERCGVTNFDSVCSLSRKLVFSSFSVATTTLARPSLCAGKKLCVQQTSAGASNVHCTSTSGRCKLFVIPIATFIQQSQVEPQNRWPAWGLTASCYIYWGICTLQFHQKPPGSMKLESHTAG